MQDLDFHKTLQKLSRIDEATGAAASMQRRNRDQQTKNVTGMIPGLTDPQADALKQQGLQKVYPELDVVGGAGSLLKGLGSAAAAALGRSAISKGITKASSPAIAAPVSAPAKTVKTAADDAASLQKARTADADAKLRAELIDQGQLQNVRSAAKRETEKARTQLQQPATTPASRPSTTATTTSGGGRAPAANEPAAAPPRNQPPAIQTPVSSASTQNITGRPAPSRDAAGRDEPFINLDTVGTTVSRPGARPSSGKAAAGVAMGSIPSVKSATDNETQGIGTQTVTGPVQSPKPATTGVSVDTSTGAAAGGIDNDTRAAAVKPATTGVSVDTSTGAAAGGIDNDTRAAAVKPATTDKAPSISKPLSTRIQPEISASELYKQGLGDIRSGPHERISADTRKAASDWVKAQQQVPEALNKIGDIMNEKLLEDLKQLSGIKSLNEQMQTVVPPTNTSKPQTVARPAQMNIGQRQPTQADLNQLRASGQMDKIMLDPDPNALNKALGYTGAVNSKPIRAPQDSAPVDAALPTVKEEDAELEEMMRLAGMEETLHGKQHKLDVDHDGEIEASDLAKLRSQKVDEQDMEEGNEFSGALDAARDAGEKTFNVGGKTYPVKESQLAECGDMGPMANGMQDQQKSHMSINTNMSSDGTKTVTVSAEGDAAVELMQLLNLAGMQSEHDQDDMATMYEAKDSKYEASTTPDEKVIPLDTQLKGGDGEVAGKEKKMTPDGYKNSDNPLAMKKNVEESHQHNKTLSFLKEYESILQKKNLIEEVDLSVNDDFAFELGDVLLETYISQIINDKIILEADEKILGYLNKLGYINLLEDLDPHELADKEDRKQQSAEEDPTEKAEQEEQVNEAEYQGRNVPLGKRMQGDVKKFKVYVKNPAGRVVKVNFGDPNMRIKKSNPARRKSFRARHRCDNPGPRHKARYWSCKAW